MNDSALVTLIAAMATIELTLTGAALYHIFTHKVYKTGSRLLWVLVSLIEIVGPIIYFVFGRASRKDIQRATEKDVSKGMLEEIKEIIGEDCKLTQ